MTDSIKFLQFFQKTHQTIAIYPSQCTMYIVQFLDSSLLMYSSGQDLKNKTEEAAAIARAEARAEEMERMVKAANADKHNILLYNECLNAYANSMRIQSLNDIETYCTQSNLQQLHNDAKSSSLSKVCIQFSEDFIAILIFQLFQLIFFEFGSVSR